MRKKWAATLAAVVGLFLGAFVVPSAALAVPSGCLAAYICSWTGPGFTGSLYQWSGGYIRQRPGHCLNLTGTINNSITSGYNNAGGAPGYVMWFSDAGCTGAYNSGAIYTSGSFSYPASDPRNDKYSSIYVP